MATHFAVAHWGRDSPSAQAYPWPPPCFSLLAAQLDESDCGRVKITELQQLSSLRLVIEGELHAKVPC